MKNNKKNNKQENTNAKNNLQVSNNNTNATVSTEVTTYASYKEMQSEVKKVRIEAQKMYTLADAIAKLCELRVKNDETVKKFFIACGYNLPPQDGKLKEGVIYLTEEQVREDWEYKCGNDLMRMKKNGETEVITMFTTNTLIAYLKKQLVYINAKHEAKRNEAEAKRIAKIREEQRKKHQDEINAKRALEEKLAKQPKTKVAKAA